MRHYGKILAVVLSVYALAIYFVINYDLFKMRQLLKEDFFVRDDNNTLQFHTYQRILNIKNFGNINQMDLYQKNGESQMDFEK